MVLRLLATLARVFLGFVLASLTAGLVTVLFVNTPAEVLSQPTVHLPETASQTLDLALLTATHASLFSAAFILIAAGVGEWFAIRALPFYLIAGCAIALLGFVAQFSSEVAGQPTILNNYAIEAFLTAGFMSGFVYWLASGQFAGGPVDPEEVSDSQIVRFEKASRKEIAASAPATPARESLRSKMDLLRKRLASRWEEAADAEPETASKNNETVELPRRRKPVESQPEAQVEVRRGRDRDVAMKPTEPDKKAKPAPDDAA